MNFREVINFNELLYVVSVWKLSGASEQNTTDQIDQSLHSHIRHTTASLFIVSVLQLHY